MTLVGEIFFGNEKIDFLFVMGVFGRKNVYVKNKGKMYDLRYLADMFKSKKIISAVKIYYNSGMFEEHAKKVLDGTETEPYIFKFIDLIIKMKLSDIVKHNSIITKITELEAEFDEENDTFFITAITGNKIIHRDENNIRFFYRRIKLVLGYYNSDLNKIINLVGSYIDLKKEYKIIDISGKESSGCFAEKREKTLLNFKNIGFISVEHNTIIDNTVKEKLYEEIEDRLSGIIRGEMLKKLVEY